MLQFDHHAHSAPTPTTPPDRVFVSEPMNTLLSTVVRLKVDLSFANAAPPVTYSSRFGDANTPMRPRMVASQFSSLVIVSLRADSAVLAGNVSVKEVLMPVQLQSPSMPTTAQELNW